MRERWDDVARAQFPEESSSVLSGSMASPALVSRSKQTAYRGRRSFVIPSRAGEQDAVRNRLYRASPYCKRL